MTGRWARVVRLVGLGLLAGGVGACSRGHEADAAVRTPVTDLGAENVAVVAMDLVREGPVMSGVLSPVRTAQLRAQVSGSVLETRAEGGQAVAANAVLARIDATAIRDAERSAASAVTSSEIAARYADAQQRRYDTLLAAGAVAERDRESAVQQAAQSHAALDNARASLAQAEQQLAWTEVRAPFAGVVSARSVSVGDVVQVGTPMYGVVDPSVLQLQAQVPAERIRSVHVGQPVTFTLNGYGTRAFDGRITRINPVADASTQQVVVYAELPNPGNALVGGLFATGRVVTASVRGLVVPLAAIDLRNLRPSVLRVRHGVVERVEVGLGVRDDPDERIELTSGVAAGDTLLLGQAQALAPGAHVRVTGAPTDDSIRGVPR